MTSFAPQAAATYSRVEETLHAITHGVGFIAACVGLIMMLQKVDGVIAQLVCAVYGVSMMLMFLSSTLYHWASSVSLKAKLKVFDHVSIYLLIAGTYTPYTVFAVGGEIGILANSIIWGLAVIGIGCKFFASRRFPKLSLVTYLLMGWLAIFFAYPLYNAIETKGFWLLLAGGLCYTFGAVFYAAKQFQFTHLVWHIFVMAGCACHFWSIYQFVI
ncbi:PAQR family membrane homeostasis protein TrhA [Paraglaciecola sp. 2405UD69-4]|uniref:PAQR family membrane homeostasis protein TrhA n=1 Tax=Paraglaciecola sp. 2405UD69-4 TaxID=3391836 RepID=UPI0039C9878A